MTRWLLILVVLTGCGPHTAKDCRREAEGTMRSLIRVLEQVETREDLLAREGKLKKIYAKMADLVVEAERLGGTAGPPNGELNERLKEELVRVYALPGGREIVERAQGEALHRLADLR